MNVVRYSRGTRILSFLRTIYQHVRMMRRGLEEAVDTVRDVVKRVVRPAADGVDAEARWPAEGIRALQQAKLGGLTIPHEFGGLGLGIAGLVRVCEQIGRACASTALCFGMHCVGAAVIAAKATTRHVDEYLDPISEGEHITTLALSEPGSGSHFYYPLTTFERREDRLRVEGKKVFVTNGGYADSYVLSVTGGEAGHAAGEFSCLVLRDGSPGMKWGPDWNGLGLRGNASRSLDLDGVEIPESDFLGEEGDEIWYVFQVIAPFFLAAMAATYLGVADEALRDAVRHVRERHFEHSGADLADSQVVQHEIGSLWAEVERTRRLIYFSAEDADAGGPDALLALFSAKAEAAACVVNVVNAAMKLMGGRAYQSHAPMWRRLRDARAADVMAPTTGILKTWTGRMLLDIPILKE